MCGIVGIVDFENPINLSTIERMTQSLEHRGPDGSGCHVEEYVGLGHRRLSIIDLSDSGKQPMISACGRYTLVYNGELYNYRELRKDLEGKGCIFIGRSDSEVVLNALIDKGSDALEGFNGMFTFAFWDNKEGRVLLGRDRFGIKPLYYLFNGIQLVFGSEIKAIKSHSENLGELNLQGFHEYMWYGNTLSDHTFYDKTKKLLPGHFLEFSKKSFNIEKYWSIERTPRVRDSENIAVKKVRKLLDESIERHLLADVPVGVFLSGGIDSSAITALASAKSQSKLKTYAVAFDFDKGNNELDKARFVADKFNTDHHEVQVKADDLVSVLKKLAHSHDEPFADAANIPLYLLCNQLKDEIKVVLQGDGGDEIFAGYRRYNTLSYEKSWRAFSYAGFHLQNILPKTRYFDRLQRYFYSMSRKESYERMALLLTQDSPLNSPLDLLSKDMKDKISNTDPFQSYRECAERFSELDPVQRMLYTDCEIILPTTYLEKVDKPTMANSMEVRVPLLDKELTDYVIGLPSHYKVKRGQKKWLLREAMRGTVPSSILDAPKKGFGVPFSSWLKRPLAGFLKEVMLSPDIKEMNYFDSIILERKINEHISGQQNHGYALWKALMIGIWLTKGK